MSYASASGRGIMQMQGYEKLLIWEMERQQRKYDNMVRSLTRILRHIAPKHQLHVHPGGFVFLQNILDHAGLMFNFTIEEVISCVENIDDQRFELKLDEDTQSLLVRVISGHSFPVEPLEPAKLEDSGLSDNKDCAENLDGTTSAALNLLVINDNQGTVSQRVKQANYPQLDTTKLCRTLFWLLNTGIKKQGHELTADDGYFDMDALLHLPELNSRNVQSDDISRLLSTDRRFEMRRVGDPMKVQIRLRPRTIKKSGADDLRNTLYYLLKFGLDERGIKKSSDGYVDIDVLLQLDHRIMCKARRLEIIEVVERFPQKFELKATGDGADASVQQLIRLKPQTTLGHNNPRLRKLLEILRYDAPRLGLKIYAWGFIDINEMLKLKCKEFEDMTVETMTEFINDFNNENDDNRNIFTMRRNPDKVTELQVRTQRGQTFDMPAGDGFKPLEYDSTARMGRTLSFLLRHTAPQNIRDPYGFVEMDWVMAQDNMKHFVAEQVVNLVDGVDAEGIVRYEVRHNSTSGKSEIRATYGHTVEVFSVEITPILNAEEFPILVYGTNFAMWEVIKESGIKPTTLAHIHMASDLDYLMRCRFVFYSVYELLDIMIHIDLKKALDDGLKFFLSDNKIILCRGNDEGRLEPKYFSRAIDIATGEELEFSKK